MRAWTRAVAVLTAMLLLASPAVGATCAAACARADAGAKVAVEGAADHCARAGRDAAPSSATAGTAHACGNHGWLAIDDARLPRLDAAVPLALARTTVVAARPGLTRLGPGRHGGPAPPCPGLAPLVLRL